MTDDRKRRAKERKAAAKELGYNPPLPLLEFVGDSFGGYIFPAGDPVLRRLVAEFEAKRAFGIPPHLMGESRP